MQYPLTFKAAILREINKPLSVESVSFNGPLQPGQVMVRVFYSGICGKQIEEISGASGPDKFLPHMLGHEGSGIVLDIGPGVSKVAVGDKVVLHWVKSGGIDAPTPIYFQEGKRINAGWVTTFNEYAVVAENRMTKVPGDTNLSVACLLGCAVTTGIGVIINEARVKPGDSVAIFGCGGVGLNAIQGAVLVNAFPIIAVDKNPEALKLAKDFGATHCVLVKDQDPVISVKALTDGVGAEFVIITNSDIKGAEMAVEAGRIPGTVFFTGVPAKDSFFSIRPFAIHCQRSLLGSYGGGTVPERDIIRYLMLAQQKKIRLVELVSQRIKLEEVNEGIRCLTKGVPGRCVIDMS